MATIQIAFYKGRSKLFNRAVAWWTRGVYSHCEFITGYTEEGLAICWSSSFSDGGVRMKHIELKRDNWDIVEIEVTESRKAKAIEWFKKHNGDSYDLIGLVGFVWGAVRDDETKWFCSEALAEAFGCHESYRMHPNVFYSLIVTYQDWIDR